MVEVEGVEEGVVKLVEEGAAEEEEEEEEEELDEMERVAGVGVEETLRRVDVDGVMGVVVVM